MQWLLDRGRMPFLLALRGLTLEAGTNNRKRFLDVVKNIYRPCFFASFRIELFLKKQ